MKKSIILLLALSVTSLAAQTTETTRTHVWSTISLDTSLSSTIGAFIQFGSRYDFDIKTVVDGTNKSPAAQGSWLNEIFIGPTFSFKLGKNLSLKTGPQYRLMFWYLDDAAAKDSYTEHTLHWPTILKWKAGPVTLLYRLILWNRFAVGTTGYSQDNEFLTRHYLAAALPFGKGFSARLGGELYLLHTADEADGQKPLFRTMLQASLLWKALPFLDMSLGYEFQRTFKAKTESKTTTVDDHYILFSLLFNLDLRK